MCAASLLTMNVSQIERDQVNFSSSFGCGVIRKKSEEVRSSPKHSKQNPQVHMIKAGARALYPKGPIRPLLDRNQTLLSFKSDKFKNTKHHTHENLYSSISLLPLTSRTCLLFRSTTNWSRAKNAKIPSSQAWRSAAVDSEPFYSTSVGDTARLKPPCNR